MSHSSHLSSPEASLIKRAAKQDEQAIRQIVDAHKDMVYGTCLRILRNAADAEDASQATFMLFLEKSGDLKQGTVLGGWLYKSATLISRRHLRTTARRKRHEEEANHMNDPQPSETQALWNDLRPELDAAIHSLPAKYRDLVILRYLEEKSTKEVAEQLGVSPSAVTTGLGRGIEKLRTRFRRKGIILSASALAATLTQNASACSAPSTLTPHIMTAVGSGTMSAAVSSSITLMVQGAVKHMLWSKILTTTAAITLTAVVLSAASVMESQSPSGSNVNPQSPTESKIDLLGTWKLVKMVEHGEEEFSEAEIPIFNVTVDETSYREQDTTKLYYQLDDTVKPAQLKFYRDPELQNLDSLAIVRVRENLMDLCMVNYSPGTDFPTGFISTKEKRYTLLTWKRKGPTEINAQNPKVISSVQSHLKNIFTNDFTSLENSYASTVTLMPGHEFLKAQYGLVGDGERNKMFSLPKENLIQALKKATEDRQPRSADRVEQLLQRFKISPVETEEGNFQLDVSDAYSGTMTFSIQPGDALAKVSLAGTDDYLLFHLRNIDGTWKVVSEFLD